MMHKQLTMRRIKLCRSQSWRRSNQALFLFSLLLVPTHLFSADPGASGGAAGAGGSPSVCDWMPGGDCNDAESLLQDPQVYEVTQHSGPPEKSAADSVDSSSFEDDTVLPDHVVKSCLSDMPPILQGIHRYLKSPDSEDSERAMPAFHRFLLAGPSGSSKSTTSLAIAQDLGVVKEVHEAGSFIGKFRSHTAVNLKKLFQRLLAEVRRKVVIMNEADRLFEGHTNTHTDHADSAHLVWSFLDQIERKKLNIIIIWAVNHPDRLPVEMKSRFRVQYAYLPLIDTDKWFSQVGVDLRQRRGVTIAFSQIAVEGETSDSKAEEDDAPELPDIAELRKEVGQGLSRRDLAFVNNAIVVFAYNDHDASAGGDIVLTDRHVAQALVHFLDKDKVLDYSVVQEPEAEIQRRRHEEAMQLQRDGLQQQKDQHEASVRQASLHQAQGIRANFQAQAHQRPQESEGFSVGAGGFGINRGRTSASGFSEETADDLEKDLLTDEQRCLLDEGKKVNASASAATVGAERPAKPIHSDIDNIYAEGSDYDASVCAPIGTTMISKGCYCTFQEEDKDRGIVRLQGSPLLGHEGEIYAGGKTFYYDSYTRMWVLKTDNDCVVI